MFFSLHVYHVAPANHNQQDIVNVDKTRYNTVNSSFVLKHYFQCLIKISYIIDAGVTEQIAFQLLPRNEASPGCLARYYRGMRPLRDVWPGTTEE